VRFLWGVYIARTRGEGDRKEKEKIKEVVVSTRTEGVELYIYTGTICT
jgi:hypothetical protein